LHLAQSIRLALFDRNRPILLSEVRYGQDTKIKSEVIVGCICIPTQGDKRKSGETMMDFVAEIQRMVRFFAEPMVTNK
jgi:hypothetical protein